MCTERDKAAAFNAEYKAITREAVRHYQIYNEDQMCHINRDVLIRTIELAYKQESQSAAQISREKVLKNYNSDNSLQMPPQNSFMTGLICEGDEVWLKIQEAYTVENCEIRQYLPIITAFLIMHGTQMLTDHGDKALEKMQFSAFWIYGLHQNPGQKAEEKMRENSTWIADILTAEEQKMYDDESEQSGLIIQKYHDLLKKLFPKFMQRKGTKIDREVQQLKKQIVTKSLLEIAPLEQELVDKS